MLNTLNFLKTYWLIIATIIIVAVTGYLFYYYTQQINELEAQMENEATNEFLYIASGEQIVNIVC